MTTSTSAASRFNPRRKIFWRLDAGDARAVAIALGIKTLVTLAMILFYFNFTTLTEVFDVQLTEHGNAHENPMNTAHRKYTGDDTTSWFLPLANWDAQLYLIISEFGYNSHAGTQFYPPYPLLIRALSLAMPRPMAALVLGYLFVAGFAVFLCRIAAHYRCARPALPLLVVMTFPTAFYTSAFYSEALFLFLLTGFYYYFFCARKRIAFLYFALLPFARGNAAFVFGGLLLWRGGG